VLTVAFTTYVVVPALLTSVTRKLAGPDGANKMDNFGRRTTKDALVYGVNSNGKLGAWLTCVTRKLAGPDGANKMDNFRCRTTKDALVCVVSSVVNSNTRRRGWQTVIRAPMGLKSRYTSEEPIHQKGKS
jgi:hypothetical protein